MSKIELYEFPISGNCHKVRMLLSFLKLEFQSHTVNGAAAAHKSPEFLAMNPFGQVPVLVDGPVVLRDSQAILVYLGKKYGNTDWLPDDAAGMAKTFAWLSVAANEISRGPAALRSHYKFNRALDVAEAGRISDALLGITDAQLRKTDWLTGNNISIADLAMYPYLALAHEGTVDLAPFAGIQRWLRQIQALPGFVSMPGILA